MSRSEKEFDINRDNISDNISKEDYIDLEQLVQKELDKVTSCYEQFTTENNAYLNSVNVNTINNNVGINGNCTNENIDKLNESDFITESNLLDENVDNIKKISNKSNVEWSEDLENVKSFNIKTEKEIEFEKCSENDVTENHLYFCQEICAIDIDKSFVEESKIYGRIHLKNIDDLKTNKMTLNNEDTLIEIDTNIENFIECKKNTDSLNGISNDTSNIKDTIKKNIIDHDKYITDYEKISDRTSTCRLCADDFHSENIMYIYDDRYKSLDLEWKINTCLPIKVTKLDPLPQWICETCYSKVDDLYIFTNSVLKANKKLTEKINMNNNCNKDTSRFTLLKKDILINNTNKKNSSFPEKHNNTSINFKSENLENFNELITDIEYLDYDEDLLQNFKNMNEESNDDKNNGNKISQNIIPADLDEQNYGNSVYSIISQKISENTSNYFQDEKIIDEIVYCKENVVSCRICSCKLKNALCAIEHSSNNHSDKINSEYPCSLCKTVNNSLNRLRQHIIGVHYTGMQSKFYPCKQCKKKFSVQNSLERHSCDLNTSNSEELICKFCNIIFPTKIRLNFHKPFHSNGLIPLYCIICNTFSRDEGEFFDHVKNTHGPKEKKLKCLQCEKIFPTLKSMKMHEKVHKNIRNHKCETCGKTFLDKQTLNEHSVTHMSVKPFQCHICGKYLNRLSRLKAHLLRHESDSSEPRPVSVCTICHEAFSDENSAEIHENTFHLEENIGKKCIIKMIPVVFRCEFCERCFSEKTGLKNHIPVHNEDNPYTCHICSARFSTYTRCTTHKTTHGYFKGDKAEKDVYPVVKYFVCNYCQKEYLLYTYLNVHRRLKHSDNIYMYKCQLCPERFSTSWAIAYHRKKAHNIANSTKIQNTTEDNNNCKTCEIKFDTEDAYNTHMLKEHPVMLKVSEGENGHQCDGCGKIYNRKESLNNHLPCRETTKTNVQIPEQNSVICCKFCNEEFKTIKKYDAHLRQQHKNEKPFQCELCLKNFRTRNMHKMHMKIHTDERPFLCTICGLTFRRLYALKIHKMSHENLKLYSCKKCPKKFQHKIDYQKHVNLTHNDGFVLLLDDELEKASVSNQPDKIIKKRTLDEYGNVLIAPKIINTNSDVSKKLQNSYVAQYNNFIYNQIETNTDIKRRKLQSNSLYENEIQESNLKQIGLSIDSKNDLIYKETSNFISENDNDFSGIEINGKVNNSETIEYCENLNEIITGNAENQILIMTNNGEAYSFDENNQYVYNIGSLQNSHEENEMTVLIKQSDDSESLHYFVQIDGDVQNEKQLVLDESGNIILQ